MKFVFIMSKFYVKVDLEPVKAHNVTKLWRSMASRTCPPVICFVPKSNLVPKEDESLWRSCKRANSYRS